MALKFSVEGNIATGKSTFLRALQQHAEFQSHVGFYQEPVHMWQNVNETGHNILECFYKDPQRYAYFFQNYVFLTRFMQYNDALTNEEKKSICFFERSVFTDKMVFAKTAIENKCIQPIEAEVYNAWFRSIINVLPNLIPDVFVYLRASPDACQRRLHNRAREEEKHVDIEYLKQIHEYHEQWFIEGSDFIDEKNGIVLRQIQGDRTHPLLHGKKVWVIDCEHYSGNENEAILKFIHGFLDNFRVYFD